MTAMRHRSLHTFPAWLAGVCLLSLSLAAATPFSPDVYLKHVKYLASDDLQGRGNGSRELEKAGDYIASQFKTAGLKPGAPDGTWFQSFEIVTGLTVSQGNQLSLHAGAQRVSFDLGKSYYPMSTTAGDSTKTASAELKDTPLVFAGYGIDAKQYMYDDYANVDVHDKAVIVFSHEPQENDPQSRFAGTQLTRFT